MSFFQTYRAARQALAKRPLQRDGEGRVIVSMRVSDDSDFLSGFSAGETPVISADVAEFIENSTQSLSPREQITLRISGSCIDKGEKQDYQAAIKQYYVERFAANEKELKRNFFIVLALAALGVLVLAMAFQITHAIWAEVVDIAAWVLLWEAVDISVLGSHHARSMRRRYLSLMNAKVEFV